MFRIYQGHTAHYNILTERRDCVCDSCVIPYVILTYLRTEIGLYFVSKLVSAVTPRLGVNSLATTKYYIQTNSQVLHVNRTIVALLRSYVADHQTEW